MIPNDREYPHTERHRRERNAARMRAKRAEDKAAVRVLREQSPFCKFCTNGFSHTPLFLRARRLVGLSTNHPATESLGVESIAATVFLGIESNAATQWGTYPSSLGFPTRFGDTPFSPRDDGAFCGCSSFRTRSLWNRYDYGSLRDDSSRKHRLRNRSFRSRVRICLLPKHYLRNRNRSFWIYAGCRGDNIDRR